MPCGSACSPKHWQLIRHFVVTDKESSCSEMPQYAANPYVRIPAPVLSLLPTTSTPGNHTQLRPNSKLQERGNFGPIIEMNLKKDNSGEICQQKMR